MKEKIEAAINVIVHEAIEHKCGEGCAACELRKAVESSDELKRLTADLLTSKFPSLLQLTVIPIVSTEVIQLVIATITLGIMLGRKIGAAETMDSLMGCDTEN